MTKKKTTPLLKVGRHSQYSPDMCEKLIAHMSRGLSYLAFCAVAKVSHETLYNWEQQHPEFLEAKREACDLNRLFWEEKGLAGFEDRYFNNTLLIFNMKNRFKHEWNDRTQKDTTIPFTAREILADE